MSSNPAWGPGPWDDEPDELQWRDDRTGLQCRIRRNPDLGQLNGYVGVPPGHALFGKHYDAVQVQVHGGLSWSAGEEGLYWFGFDCGHAFDLSPGLQAFYRKYDAAFSREQTYCDIDYVKQQCAELALQLIGPS